MARAPESKSLSEVSSGATIVKERRVVPEEARKSGRVWRRTARWLGLIIFLIGALLLAYVFREALYGYARFTAANGFERAFGERMSQLPRGDYAGQIGFVIATFGGELLKVLYLLLLGYLGSAIAAKGIQFFAASEAIIDEAVVADIDEEID
jgi:ABC-type phosphate/phosphonate transport system permease subunit